MGASSAPFSSSVEEIENLCGLDLGLIKSLLTNTDEKRVNGFFNYVAQFEQTKFSDYSVVLVKEAFDAFRQVNRIGDITKHSEFDLWLDRNSSVIL